MANYEPLGNNRFEGKYADSGNQPNPAFGADKEELDSNVDSRGIPVVRPTASGACKKCGFPGHLPFQCRNTIKIRPDQKIHVDISSTSSEDDTETPLTAHLKINKTDEKKQQLKDLRRQEKKLKKRLKKLKKVSKKSKKKKSSSSSDSSSSESEEDRKKKKRKRRHSSHSDDSKKKSKKHHKKRKRSSSTSSSSSKSD